MKQKLFSIISLILLSINSYEQTGMLVPQLANFDAAMLNLIIMQYMVDGAHTKVSFVHSKRPFNQQKVFVIVYPLFW